MHRSCYTHCSMAAEKTQEYSSIEGTLESCRAIVDKALERLLPPESKPPESIHRALRHSMFAGGKRLRPILCLEAARMVTGTIPAGIEELGSGLEILHTYSLIHDDLPAPDSHDLRRG